MADARLELNDGLGLRIIPLDKPQVTIGRRTENDVRLTGSDVSRDHAEIVSANGDYILRDRGSRYGTFVNETQITEHKLVTGDRLQFGRAAGTDIVFRMGDSVPSSERTPVTAVSDLRQLAALLEGLRALGSGRVLDDVLALVLDAAIEVTGAERGFIMLAIDAGLDMKLARARGRITLPGDRFDTSRKIPEEVFATGEIKIVADLLDGDLANVHMGTVALGIRHVACAPLRLVRYLDRADMPSETKSIGVLYLDSREKGSLLAPHTRTALDTLATEAGVAIENARLYRETLEKARIEHELRIAAEIQRALLPEGSHSGPFYEGSGTSVSARAIGGDFYDMIEMPDGSFGFLVGDVAGKGPAAALLTSKILGIFSAFAATCEDPAETMSQLNKVLTRRAIDARYATCMYGRLSANGEMVYCSAGHNPALVYGTDGLRRIEADGMPVGLFDFAPYSSSRCTLKPGDTIVMYSDGVTEAQSSDGSEFGEARLIEVVQQHHGEPAGDLLKHIVEDVQTFARGVEQYDDVTALVVRYLGPGRAGGA
jgi:serine phosphatase RsbU (regulator of sigma subunit)/pSer/pThr/pTyr-binding forkhead associated (FHA) protein